MSNKTTSKRKIAGDDGAHVKQSAVKSSKVSTVKHDQQAQAMATSQIRKQGGGAYKTAGRNPTEPN